MKQITDDANLHIQAGRQRKVAVVFSCPGRHEEIAGRPAAKTTGKNLEILLSLLSRALDRSDLARSDITITNAWPCVEYQAKTGRSEATAHELKAAYNLQRLERELEDITDFVIFCGAKARYVAQCLKLKHDPKFVYIRHLGSRGLLLIRSDVEGRPIVAADDRISAEGKQRQSKAKIQAENTEKRLAVVAHSVVAQLEG